MSGVTYSVDLTQLDATVADLVRAQAAIERELAELDAAVARLQGVWVGEAATAQVDAHRRWAAAAARMRDGLERMRAAARTAHGNYESAADTNATMWGSIA